MGAMFIIELRACRLFEMDTNDEWIQSSIQCFKNWLSNQPGNGTESLAEPQSSMVESEKEAQVDHQTKL